MMQSTGAWRVSAQVMIFCLGGMMGCNKPAAQAAKDADTQVIEQPQVESTSGEAHTHHGSGHDDGAHHHHFDDPQKYAETWNDPARDAWQRPEEIVAALSIAPGDVVVDIGAGTGYMVAHLSRAVGETGEVMALDIEENMVKYLAKKKPALGPAMISPRKVSSESPALKPESVNAVMTLNTWHHLAGRDAYAKKVYAGLKPGGKFVVVDFEMDAEPGPPAQMRLAPDVIVKELEGAGFGVTIATESMPRHYMIVGVKP